MVIVQSTCNGGIDWHLLQQLEVSDKYTQPMYVFMELSHLFLSYLISFLTVLHYCFSRSFHCCINTVLSDYIAVNALYHT